MNALGYLKLAHKHYPRLSYAWGLIGIAAAAAIVASLFKNPIVAVPVVLVMIAGMFVLAVLARADKKGPLAPVAAFLLWVCAIAFAAALFLVLGAAAFGAPKNLAVLLFAKTVIAPLPTEGSVANPVRITTEGVIRTPTWFWIRHYLGNPVIDVRLNLLDPVSRKLTFEELRMELIDPNGSVLPMTMSGTYAPMNGQYIPGAFYNAPLSIEQPWTLAYRFVYATAQPDPLLMRADQEYAAAQPVTPAKPFELSLALLADIQHYQVSAWKWVPGKWQLRIQGRVEQQQLTRTFQFDLTPENINQLHGTDAGYARGLNLAWAGTFTNSNGLNIELLE